MSPDDQKERFLAFADRLESGDEISPDERQYLQRIFFEMGSGRDAAEALGLKYTAGNSKRDAFNRRDRSLVINWMECAIKTEIDKGLGLSLSQAIQAVVDLGDGEWTNPKTNQKHTYLDQYGQKGARLPKYSYLTVEKIWNSKKNKHMRNAIRGALDTDSPYKYKKIDAAKK